ncbi:Hsp20/alpha crystallin family protein [Amnibacterium kyonggiense]|uniref:HSP20 family protein n=1 Tax=Amnibacterium kyonggiense TaxID=595671 RepID=A0A4R7FKI0_9MICO|nr:Hsp20/alpha crystallin family protein [Amnibacterium kyonggiense]TDS76856.1 HSP20 family protein [Amnibacterium kyonggiense]
MSRNLARFDPFLELSNLQKQLFGDGWTTPFRGARLPAMDVWTEDDSKLTVEAHLPDFERSDISIDLDGDALVIQAERHEKEEDRKKRYVVRETSSSVYRRIALPEEADTEHIAAAFEQGVLTVTVPFKSLPAPKRIEIGATPPATATAA